MLAQQTDLGNVPLFCALDKFAYISNYFFFYHLKKLFQPALFVWEDFFLMIFNGYSLIFLIPLKQVLVNYIFMETFPF